MASVKIKFRPSSGDGDLGTIYYRVIHNRVVRQMATSFKIYKHEWNNSKSIVILQRDNQQRREYLREIQLNINEDIHRLRLIINLFEKNGVSYTADDVLFSILKDLRKKLSKRMNVPPFVIFQDGSLEAMATSYPITLEELQNIPGVGAGKAKRYGDEFIKLIKSYVEENDVIRPEDLRVRTVAKNSARKIAIIQAIDRRVALDDLAERLGMSMEEMLEEIEAIVYSGTKLNIKYFIEEVVDPDEEFDIYDYFRHAENDSIKLAMEELGEDDYDEINVRLVRIKFHSELGN